MNANKIYEELFQLGKTEHFLKDYYKRNQKFYPITKLNTLISPVESEVWGRPEGALHRADSFHQLKEPFELREEDFFTSDYDIRILRNLRYTTVSDHQHTFFEMMYLLNGECRNVIDGQELYMKAGDMCIIPPQVEHSIEVVTDSVLLNILIRTSTFTETFIPMLKYTNILWEFFNEILYSNNYKKYLIFHAGEDKIIRDYVLEMYQEQQMQMCYSSNILNGLLIILFGKLLQRHGEDVEYPVKYVEKYDVIPKITAYIRKNCRHITLSSCAERFHFNRQYLSSMLKKHTGKTFSVLLTEARMTEAAELLQKSARSVQEIADSLGYQDAAYFMKVFKKYYGTTPSNYRK